MYKHLIRSILILSMLFLSAYSIGWSRVELLNQDSDETKANERLEQVIKAIMDKDKDAVKPLFSKKALSEADDFDGSMNDMFDFSKVKLIHGKNQVVPQCMSQMIMVMKPKKSIHSIM